MVAIRSEGQRNPRTRIVNGVFVAVLTLVGVGGWWSTQTPFSPTGLLELEYSSKESIDYPMDVSTVPVAKRPTSTDRVIPKPAKPLLYDHEWLTDDKSINGLWEDSGCQKFREKEQPIPSEELWNMLRETYVAVVGKEESRIASTTSSPRHGFGVSFEAKQAGEKGRGVFAKQDVAKGDLVWSATRFTAVFKTADLYRTFLRSLPYYECCQAMGYTWPAKTKKEGKKPWIAVDLDEGALMNSGSHGYGKKEYKEDLSNTKCVSETKEHPKGACFAMRDISSGEEFLCNYDGFSSASWFKDLGI